YRAIFILHQLDTGNARWGDLEYFYFKKYGLTGKWMVKIDFYFVVIDGANGTGQGVFAFVFKLDQHTDFRIVSDQSKLGAAKMLDVIRVPLTKRLLRVKVGATRVASP